MTSAKFQLICQRVADTVNLDVKSGAVTPEQVALVASGTERTVSHPIVQEIQAELRSMGVEVK